MSRLRVRFDPSNLGRKAWNALRSELIALWKAEADRILSAQREYAEEYKQNIDVFIAGKQLEFQVKGFRATKVELGWAPPPSKGKIEDGLGEYDGTEKDMRTFIMQKVHGKNEETGVSYTRLNFELGRSIPEIVAETRDRMRLKQFQTRVGAQRGFGRSKAYKTAAELRKALNAVGVTPSKANGQWQGGLGRYLPGEWDNVLPLHKKKHHYPLVSKVVKRRARVLSTWRTITDSDDQVLVRKLWFTKGTRPYKVMARTAPKFSKLILRFIRGM